VPGGYPSTGCPVSAADVPPFDPTATIRTREYGRLLLLAGVIGLVAALGAWSFLTVVPWIQTSVLDDLPVAIGFAKPPSWWPIPVLAIAGLITAFAIVRLPGAGGSVPAEGLGSGPPTRPIDLPGILLAGLATLGLGLVLGPSSPVIAIGAGLALFVLNQVKKDAPQQVRMMIAAAGSCASFSMVFRSPLISTIIILEATGVGGPMFTFVALPGLLAAGIGSVVYLGLGYLSGLSVDAYAVYPLELSPMGDLTLVQIGWTVALALITTAACVAVTEGGRRVHRAAVARPFVVIPLAGVAVAVLAIIFGLTGQSVDAVLFSGSSALVPLVDQAAALSVGTIALLLLLKGIAWSISMGSFRGGPVFPAIFMGTVGGFLASHLPGLPEGAAVATVMAASVTAILRLPLSSVILAAGLTGPTGAAALTLVVISVVVSYIAAEKIFDRLGSSQGRGESAQVEEPPPGPHPGPTSTRASTSGTRQGTDGPAQFTAIDGNVGTARIMGLTCINSCLGR
jgi:H+/Cl- antiporter ClcA